MTGQCQAVGGDTPPPIQAYILKEIACAALNMELLLPWGLLVILLNVESA